MKLSLRSVSLLALLSLCQAATSQAQTPPAKPAPAKPSPAKTAGTCAVVTGSVRAEAYGYTHVVSLRNGCDKPVQCEVWTDVDPTPRQVLQAAPGESVDVVTRIGAPSREVTAHKECRFR